MKLQQAERKVMAAPYDALEVHPKHLDKDQELRRHSGLAPISNLWLVYFDMVAIS